jgi:glycosyltransferase involved in cell wall biosynthesis
MLKPTSRKAGAFSYYPAKPSVVLPPGIGPLSPPLEISVIVSTYQRPQHLRRCLASLAAQRDVAGRFEVIVVDDGSRDETAEVVSQFRSTSSFPVKFATHPHDGFQLARCRNAGIRLSAAPYLLFTDGDCIFPPDHLRQHLSARRPGVVRAGDCIKLDQATSDKINEAAITSGRFLDMIAPRVRRSLRKAYAKALIYQTLRHAQRPKLIGWNMAVWREQLEQINGFDERYRGWGCEDDDLANRLRMSGARICTALGYTQGYHLWHPPHSTTPQRWHEGPNVAYFRRPAVLARCLEGIRSRSLRQVSVRLIYSAEHQQFARELSDILRERSHGPELELMLWPCGNSFSVKGSCRVIVADQGAPLPASIERTTHATLQMDALRDVDDVLDQLQRLLAGQTTSGAGLRTAA